MRLLTFLLSFALAFSSTAVSTDIVEPTEEILMEEYFDEDEPIEEYVCCFVDASNIGLGNLVEPTDIVFNGENCAEIIVKFLESSNLTPIYSGSTGEGFYLYAVEGIDTDKILISDSAKEILSVNNIEYTENVYEKGVLGEFDLTDASGWMFKVNDEIPSVGMCDYIPKPGDTITLCFTLCYGKDVETVE
ncbi:MAG: DUF4430 domain-containing protein [Clostridia bacterium]